MLFRSEKVVYVDVQLEDEWETEIFLNITYICVDMAKQAGWVNWVCGSNGSIKSQVDSG